MYRVDCIILSRSLPVSSPESTSGFDPVGYSLFNDASYDSSPDERRLAGIATLRRKKHRLINTARYSLEMRHGSMENLDLHNPGKSGVHEV